MSDFGEEYVNKLGQTIVLDKNGPVYRVGCWNADNTNCWLKSFSTQKEAKAEFEKWRN